MREIRETIGYLMGLVLFVVLVPFIMWLVSDGIQADAVQIVIFAVLAAAGLALSIWSIFHMRFRGKGNPMDAFNHEVAPRTQNLMTDGPYRICRNPMLLGVLIYYIGVLVLLASLKATGIFVLYVIIMMVQVSREEKRLEADFGDEYRAYKQRTKKLIPFIW